MTSSSHRPGGTVAHQFETMEQQVRAGLAGMWVFLATEMLFFGGVFVGFAVYRTQYPVTFAEAAGHLDLLLGSINTAVLLTSGAVMAFADPLAEARRRGALLGVLGGTACLGLVFLAIKGVEYAKEIAEQLAPFGGLAFVYPGANPEQAQLFFSYYFALTGLHAVHMAIGIGALAGMALITWRWRDPPRIARQIRIVGLYWGFVDVVWMFVFTALYLLRG